jgi:hypothetical protein
MDSKAGKKNSGKKSTRVNTPIVKPAAKSALVRTPAREAPVLLNLTPQALKKLRPRLISCSPWLDDPEKP